MKNKIFWILSIIILLVSVFSMQIFGAVGGITSGGNLYSRSTFIKPDYVFFNNLNNNGAITSELDLTIPLSSLLGGDGDLRCYGGGTEIEVSCSSGTDSDMRNLTRIEVQGWQDLYCNSFGLKYQDNTISFNNSSYLADYLFDNTDVCPTYISAIPASISYSTMTCTVVIYNGNEPVYSNTFDRSSNVMSSLYSRLVRPFFNEISTWVRNLDIEGWHTLEISNCQIRSGIDNYDMNSLDYIQLATYRPVQDGLNDYLSFNSVADTSIVEKYDLNPLSFIWDTLESLFNMTLFIDMFGAPFTIGGLVSIILGFYGFILIFKAFSGG